MSRGSAADLVQPCFSEAMSLTCMTVRCSFVVVFLLLARRTSSASQARFVARQNINKAGTANRRTPHECTNLGSTSKLKGLEGEAASVTLTTCMGRYVKIYCRDIDA